MTAPLKTIPSVPYEVCVYRTRTGEVVAWIDFIDTPNWTRGLNISGSWSVRPTLDTRSISKRDLTELSTPWYWSWAIVQGDRIHQAGPVMGETFQDGDTSTTINGVGLWTLFKDKRVLVNATRTSVGVITGTDADVAFGTGTVSDKGGPIPVANRNLSLHTIAKRIIENELAKPGGTLPIDLPTDIAGASVRTFQGPDLASSGQKLFDLTQVAGGPEIEFIHRFTDGSKTAIRHQMLIGNSRLGQLGYAHAWATGRAITKLGFDNDGSQMTSRDWDRGEGFDRNVKTGFAEQLDGVTTGSFLTRPLLETVGQLHTNNGNQAELDSYAAADVLNGQTATLVLDVEVRLEGDTGDGEAPPSPALTAVSPGDTAVLQIKDHLRLSDGIYSVRVMRMGSGSDFKTGSLALDVLSWSLT